MGSLQNKVQSIDSFVLSIRNREQARDQDFMALYNMTLQSQVKIYNDSTKLQKLEESLNKSVSNASANFNILEAVTNEMNATIKQLQQNVSENNEKGIFNVEIIKLCYFTRNKINDNNFSAPD